MARVTLEKSVKFKALVRRLNIPKPFVRGLLETMWDVAHECGNPVLGSAADVEIAAEWPGRGAHKAGSLFDALKDGKWIDEAQPDRWQIHDYWDHAPDYAMGRAEKEQERKKEKLCQHCGGPYRSTEKHSKFCCDKCRVNFHRNGCNGAVTQPSVNVTGRYAPPAPTRAPTRLKEKNSCPPDGERAPAETQGETPQGVAEATVGFDRFWAAWPSHFRKKGKTKCMRLWNRNGWERISDRIVAAVERWKVSPDWTKERGQFIPGPLPWLNDTPWETDPAEMVVAAEMAGSSDTEDGYVAVRPSLSDLPWNGGGK
jgi:hypothetical protein